MVGETAALSAALLWALASILFADAGRYIRAIHLNLFKGIVTCLLMCLLMAAGSLLAIDELALASLGRISVQGYLLLLASGVVGIGLGDTAYFACLRRIGPQKGLMLESTAPIIAALLALFLYQEYLAGPAWMGIMLTTTGVIIVVKWSQSSLGFATRLSGVVFGLLAAFCQASGIVLSRMALLAEEVEPLASALIRLFAAVIVMLVWLGVMNRGIRNNRVRQNLAQALTTIREQGLTLRLLAAVFLGTFLAIWLMQTAVKFTSAGITQSLLATCPLFGMLIGRMQGHRQIPLVWLGLLLGISGVSLLFLS